MAKKKAKQRDVEKGYPKADFVAKLRRLADAIEQGVPVVASDCCVRYPGAYLCSPTDYQDFAGTCRRVLFGDRTGLRMADQPLPVLTPEFYGLRSSATTARAA